MMPDIPVDNLDAWLVELKPYQRNAMTQLMKSMGEEEAARHWVTAQGSQQIVAFGGEQNTGPFWDRLKAEFRRFICDDSAYVKEKKELAAQAPSTKALFISVISAALGASIGHAATLIAPAVTVMLFLSAKVGHRAFCQNTAIG